jgi:urea transport system permease protein
MGCRPVGLTARASAATGDLNGMDVLIGQLTTGLSLGSILLLAALGLSLTFGQMGVINMAHGEFIMAGCYTAYVIQQIVSNTGVSLLISLVVGFWSAG